MFSSCLIKSEIGLDHGLCSLHTHSMVIYLLQTGLIAQNYAMPVAGNHDDRLQHISRIIYIYWGIKTTQGFSENVCKSDFLMTSVNSAISQTEMVEYDM